MKLFDIFMNHLQESPNYPLLADDTLPKGMTVSQVWAVSGKVYAYLKQKGIGKEDFVMICLPRGITPILAEIGVWRAGAAFVLVEDTYAPERIEYIRSNCSCKLTIDQDCWAEIQQFFPLEGYEEPDEHDAAFAVYTSGTTGNPKGVLHEYGNIDRMLLSIEIPGRAPLADPSDKFALVAPLNFVASLLITLFGLSHKVFCYVVSYATTKNPMAIGMFIIKNGITGIFLTPSYIRKMKKKPPMLKFCIIGSEPANGVYLEGMRIHNYYLMSESGFAVAHFELDKAYEEAPVGKSEFGHEILLLGEDGSPVPEGSEGEICFENRFVRGYIGLPEESSRAFVDGYYHTGDLGKINADGNLVICGRLNDMCKINGNRVEPAEIENVAKKALGLRETACRIIDDGRSVYICLYYKDKVEIDTAEAQKKMQEYLPYYMIPSFFIHLDEFPLTATGKLNRKALPAPDFSAYQKDYEAPRDEIETALCNAFAKVLELQRIGINDDFYELGGDSLGSIEAVGESGLRGLTATEIFRGRTPAGIAELYRAEHANDSGEDIDAIEEQERKKPQPLSTEQIYMVDYQLYTPLSTMYNLTSMVKIDKNIMDLERLAQALNTAARNHPALMSCIFFNEDGELMQRYAPELFQEVSVEKVTTSELKILSHSLVKPFKIVDSSLVRFHIFDAPDAGYMFMDIHHTVFDGTSMKTFLTSILKAYAEQDLKPDYYYYVLSSRRKKAESEFYLESRKYFEDRYGSAKWVRHIHVDHPGNRENLMEECFVPLGRTKDELSAFDNRYQLSPNGFFITATLLATALYEKKPNVITSWIFNGRDDLSEMDTVGLLFRNLPVAVSFRKDMTLKELLADVTDQIAQGIAHSCYPFIELNNNVVLEDYQCLLFQDELRSSGDVPGILGEEELDNPMSASQNIMDLEILNDPESGLVLMMDYASSLYEPASIERYKKLFYASVNVLYAACLEGTATVRQLMHMISKEAGEGGILSGNRWLTWLK